MSLASPLAIHNNLMLTDADASVELVSASSVDRKQLVKVESDSTSDDQDKEVLDVIPDMDLLAPSF